MAVLIEAREKTGLSQRQLSLKLRRSRTFIHRVEIGERVLDFLEAIDVAEALGMDPFDLLDRVLSHGKPKPDLAPVVVTARKRPKRNQRTR